MDDDTFQKYTTSTSSTYGMTNEEKVSYIRKVREQNVMVANNWTEAEMLREMWYHDRGYEISIAFGIKPSTEGSLAYRFNHVDFETEQTFRTYLYRFIGNMAVWGRK